MSQARSEFRYGDDQAAPAPVEIRSPGWWLQLTGLAHVAVGNIIYREALLEIVADGVVHSVPERGDRATAFWFLAAGPPLWLAGRLLRSAERNEDLAAQRTAGTALAATGLIGSAMLPASGLWAVLAIGLAASRRASLRGPGYGVVDSEDGPPSTPEPPQDAACSLESGDQIARRDRWLRLAERSLVSKQATGDGVELRYRSTSEARAELRDLADLESICCSFATWRVAEFGETIQLSVESTPGRVSAIWAMFDEDPPKARKQAT